MAAGRCNVHRGARCRRTCMFITRIKMRLNLNTTRLIRAKPVSLWSDFHSGGIHPIFLCVIVFLHRFFCGPNRGQPADQVRGHASLRKCSRPNRDVRRTARSHPRRGGRREIHSGCELSSRSAFSAFSGRRGEVGLRPPLLPARLPRPQAQRQALQPLSARPTA